MSSLRDVLDNATPNRDTALRAVNEDLFPVEGPPEGLRPAFTPLHDPAVVLREGFDLGDLGDMLGPKLSAVPWQVEVEHTGPFRGIAPTQRRGLIVGVSILDLSDDGGNDVIHRFVNWEEVMGQIGVVYANRSSAPDQAVATS